MNAEGKRRYRSGYPEVPICLLQRVTIETLCNNAHDPNGHGYQPYVGIPELQRFRSLVSTLVWSGTESNTEIQPLIGSKEGILHVTLAFVNPGEQVLVPNPGYPTYTSLSKNTRCGSNQLRPERRRRLDARFRSIGKDGPEPRETNVDQLPNMPTGANATPELYERLVDFARRKNIVIVNDNPSAFILNESRSVFSAYRGQRVLHRIQLHEQEPQYAGMAYRNAGFECRIRTMDTESKKQYRQRYVPCHATGSRHASGAEADWYEGNNHNYRGRRHLAGEIMKTLGCTYDENQVGMFLWGKIPASCKDVEELTEKVLHQARVFITPGFIFGSNGARFIRISLCCKDAKLAEALERIKQLS